MSIIIIGDNVDDVFRFIFSE